MTDILNSHWQKGKSASNWISVEDELPDDDITVLVALKSESEPVWMGYHDCEQDDWFSTDGLVFKCAVTHWAKLPEAPK